ncbi:hypothetical protein KKF91_17815 [Myxococcota bacterium]|nr:hypothetical protein [Myxococcota bacterium]MBU1432398.1 hypothetical protein [Myxococcota bacterium]MBU1899461.1 hypothetical protein [Myxococcota bacterium]
MKVRCVQCEATQDLESLSALSWPASPPQGVSALNQAGAALALERGFGYYCARCGARNLYTPAPAATEAPSMAPRQATPSPGSLDVDKVAALGPPLTQPTGAISCPKCAHQQSDAYACHRCGLVFERAGALSFDLLADHPQRAQLQARWAEIENDLSNEDAHHRFIQLCEAQRALEFAGYCYRVRPGEGPLNAAHRQRVIAAALAQGRRMDSEALNIQEFLKNPLLIAALALVVFGVMMAYLLIK